MSIFEDHALCKLMEIGVSLDSYFLVGEEGRELIGFWMPEVGERGLQLRDDELAKACKTYLASRGVRRFRSLSEVLETARREQWPGWEKHAT